MWCGILPKLNFGNWSREKRQYKTVLDLDRCTVVWDAMLYLNHRWFFYGDFTCT